MNNSQQRATSNQPTPRSQDNRNVHQIQPDYEGSFKIRQIELSLLDFKGAIERRFSELTTELPARLSREIRGLEMREQ